MEKIDVNKNRLEQLLLVVHPVISESGRVYNHCTIECRKCRFYSKGCYYNPIYSADQADNDRLEVYLEWLKGE